MIRSLLAVITAFLLLSFAAGCQSTKTQPTPATIKVVMKKYSIEPNPIRLKQGQPVTLYVSSADVQHGFSVDALKIDEPIPPGKPATITFTPQQKGEFKVQCDIICGPGHDKMQGKIIVE